MKMNMGNLDRILRVIVAIGIGGAWYMNLLPTAWASILGLLAVVFALTSVVGTCPLYMPFGINTKDAEQSN